MLLGCWLGIASATAQENRSWTADNGNGTFTNPLFYDEFSDPDILRVGDDYYLAGTTMHAVPGLVILHSKDLVNWENVSYCFDRFDFGDDRFALKNHEEIYGQGIWAPCIRYANGQFYVFSNVNGKGLQCYTAKDIHGPWTHHNMKGNIYDLGVLFDDDGKVYAIHGYGTVKCTELKPDMSGPVEGTERVIIPEGNGVGEGHHMYKINGMYYLISTDYRPNGRTLCSRSKSIWGPYETRVITADETYGYHAARLTQVPRGEKYRIGSDGTKFGLGPLDKDATACTNAHQGGIVAQREQRIGQLVVQTKPLTDLDKDRLTTIVCNAVAKEGQGLLDWNDDVHTLQLRVALVARWHPELSLPDLSTNRLLQHPETWLPFWISKNGRIMTTTAELHKIDLTQVLWNILTYEQQQALDRLAPMRISVASGRQIKVRYRVGTDVPVVSVRLQECFGMTDTPTVDNGRVPVLMELLSPGFKPVQLTSDLRSFWQSAYFDVRKELRRRYPKHAWPEDPTKAVPTKGVRRQK